MVFFTLTKLCNIWFYVKYMTKKINSITNRMIALFLGFTNHIHTYSSNNTNQITTALVSSGLTISAVSSLKTKSENAMSEAIEIKESKNKESLFEKNRNNKINDELEKYIKEINLLSKSNKIFELGYPEYKEREFLFQKKHEIFKYLDKKDSKDEKILKLRKEYIKGLLDICNTILNLKLGQPMIVNTLSVHYNSNEWAAPSTAMRILAGIINKEQDQELCENKENIITLLSIMDKYHLFEMYDTLDNSTKMLKILNNILNILDTNIAKEIITSTYTCPKKSIDEIYGLLYVIYQKNRDYIEQDDYNKNRKYYESTEFLKNKKKYNLNRQLLDSFKNIAVFLREQIATKYIQEVGILKQHIITKCKALENSTNSIKSQDLKDFWNPNINLGQLYLIIEFDGDDKDMILFKQELTNQLISIHKDMLSIFMNMKKKVQFSSKMLQGFILYLHCFRRKINSFVDEETQKKLIEEEKNIKN